MPPSAYPDVVFSVHDTGADIVRERPRPGAGAWTLFALACLVSGVGGPITLILVVDLAFAGAPPRAFGWLLPPIVVALAAWIAVNALGERLTGRGSAGTRWLLGIGLLGFGAALTTPIVLSWDEHGPNTPANVAAAVPGTLLLVGALVLVRAVASTKGALRRQARMRELRAHGRPVPGVLETVRFLERWPSSRPEFEVVVRYGTAGRVTARLLTDPERVPLPGTRLRVLTDAAGSNDVLVELDSSGPVAFDPRADDYRQPSGGDGGGGGGA
ncbi:hypothetical protein [Jiangella rhizosphaerae]|uniref:Uncharacterized protein n=1 Tax=Jiangella rhizosphaerae TaxID=2293569 RepID=A0A418KTU3_9ACTN|nr:hypothetical protein [Jiangella rhizosphaerae]RIQ29613.1 hypothetical protein DY240_08130 [Jiangella rhizosphaerae]